MKSQKADVPPTKPNGNLLIVVFVMMNIFLFTVIFTVILKLQEFTAPVSVTIRVTSAAIATAMIFVTIYAVMYRKKIKEICDKANGWDKKE